jgi:streptogramin lyase
VEVAVSSGRSWTEASGVGRVALATLAVFLIALAWADAARAAGSISEYSTGLAGEARPADVVTGPEGDLWFTGGGEISKMTPSGAVPHYTTGLQAGSQPSSLVLGEEGDIWFIDSDESGPAIGRVTPSGTITEFKNAKNQNAVSVALKEPADIILGPDGDLWFTDSTFYYENLNSAIGRVTPSGTITEFEMPEAVSTPAEIIDGPDGNLWFTDPSRGPFNRAIGKITTSGTITEYNTWTALGNTDAPNSIAVGSDGNLWFTAAHAVDKITPSGTITQYTAGLQAGANPEQIISGPGGDLWFTDGGAFHETHEGGYYEGAIGKITTAGAISEFTGHHLHPGYSRPSLVQGPDGNLWVADERGSLDRVTPSGQLTTFFLGLTEEVAPTMLTVGPGGQDIWFGEAGSPGIGKISPVTAGASPTPTVEVELTEPEGGTVTSSPPGISCPGTCSTSFPQGTVVTLTATPVANSSVFSSDLIVPGEEPCPDALPPAVPSGTCRFTVGGDALWRIGFSREGSGGGGGGGGGNAGGGSQPTAAVTSSSSPSSGQPSSGGPKQPSATKGSAGSSSATAKVQGGSASISLQCFGSTSCSGTAKLEVQDGGSSKPTSRVLTGASGGRLLIGSKGFVIAAGKKATIKVPLTKRGKALVASAGKKGLKTTLTGIGLKSRTVVLKDK